MSTSVFTPEYKVLNDLFARDITYTIPEYQRPYSWDCIGKTDRNNQVNVMWEDLFNYYQESDNKNKPYFFGSMVMIEEENKARTFEVIDGQQRLTTLTLLFVAVKCFLKDAISKLETESTQLKNFEETVKYAILNIDELIFNRASKGLKSEKKVKIERGAGYDYDEILSEVMDCNTFFNDKYKECTFEQRTIIQRYFSNKDFLQSEFEKNFLTNGFFTESNFNELDEFINFLKNRVVIIRVIATNFDVAYHVFEILNNRGLPLSSKDLLRNLIIKEFSQIGDENPNQKWVFLEENYQLDNYFISRFVESKKARNAKSTAFNDLKDIYLSKYKDTANNKKIENFYVDFKKDLETYTKIIENDFNNIELKNSIKVILNAGNSTYSHNLLLALFRNVYDETKQLSFIKNYERFIMHFLLGTSRRFQVKPIYDSIKLLDDKKIEEAKAVFILDSKEKLELFKNLDQEEIKDNEVGKLLIAKYIWIETANNKDTTVDLNLNYEKCTLEHIIPQLVNEGTNWAKDFSKKFRTENTYKLGNMTLLDIKMNSAARNFDFSKKKEIYKRANLNITNEMATNVNMNEEYIISRHKKIIALLKQSYDF